MQNDHVHELVVKGEKRDEKRKKVSIYFAGIFNGNFVSPSGISTGRGGSEKLQFLISILMRIPEKFLKKKNATRISRREKHMKPHRDGKKNMVLKKRKWQKNE